MYFLLKRKDFFVFKRICFFSLVLFFALIGKSNAVNKEFIPESMLQSSSEAKIVAYMHERITKGSSFNLEHRYFDSKTALHHAALRGFDKLVKILVEAQCPIDALDRKGYTPLMYAVAAGHGGAVETLIRLNADILVLTPKGSDLCDLVQEKGCKHTIKAIKNLMNGTWDRVKFHAYMQQHEKKVNEGFRAGLPDNLMADFFAAQESAH